MRKLALLVAAGVAATVLAVAPASPASAASLCTTVVNHSNGSQNMAVPAASGGGDNCLIGFGNLGCWGPNCQSVKRLQRTLNVCYGHNLVVDGEFGNKTYNALRDAQRRSGVRDDGTYGPNTRSAMRHESNDVPNICHDY